MAWSRSSDRYPGYLALAAALLIFGAGCGVLPTGDCTSEGRPGIRVAILDNATKQPPTAGSHIRVSDGSRVETYPLPDQPLIPLPYYQFMFERAGHYSVTIRTDGYQDWSKSGIHVKTGGCNHVKTVDVIAFLSPR